MFKFSDSSEQYKPFGDTKDNTFKGVLQSKWDLLHEESDVFQYRIDNLQERMVDGYLLQLNPERCSKRRAPEQINSIVEPFNPDKFNFTKASPREIIFNLKKENEDSDVHTIIINVSPISRYHSLLCPSMQRCLPQVATEDSIQLCLEIMFLAEDRNLRIGFNSLCALASVNHLHYHLFFESNKLPVEREKCKHIKGPLYCLDNYVAPAFCFTVSSKNAIATISKDIYKLLDYLIEHSIAHNIFITRGDNVPGAGHSGTLRVLVWPRKSCTGVKELTAFNVAVCELSGWFPVYSKEAYENLNAKQLESELSKWKIDDFEKLREDIKAIY